MIRRYVMVGLLGFVFAGCGGNPYLEASLDPAKFEGKDQAWFEENWGKPSAKTSRFFGGKVGSILVLLAEKLISHFLISLRTSAKSHWILIKIKSWTITRIRIVSLRLSWDQSRYPWIVRASRILSQFVQTRGFLYRETCLTRKVSCHAELLCVRRRKTCSKPRLKSSCSLHLSDQIAPSRIRSRCQVVQRRNGCLRD